MESPSGLQYPSALSVYSCLISVPSVSDFSVQAGLPPLAKQTAGVGEDAGRETTGEAEIWDCCRDGRK